MTATARTQAGRASSPTDLFDRVVDRRPVAVLRLLMGLVVVRHLWPDVRASILPVDRFHVPWWSWLPVVSHTGYRVVLGLGVAAGVAMVLGVATRAATIVAFGTVTYLLFVDMTGFHHNRAFLVWILFGLTRMPTTSCSLPRWLADRSPPDDTGYLWPLLMLRIIVASVYLTSGGTKLANPDWRTGLVLWDRVVSYQQHIPVGGWIRNVLVDRSTYWVLAPAALAVELFVGIAIWFPRTRLTAIWIAFMFHASIEMAASVQTFSYSAIAALLIWVTPSTRDRSLRASPKMRSVVTRLDWLHRFRLLPAEPGTPIMLIDRDGTIRAGRDATLTALSRLPLLFPAVAPALAFVRLTQPRSVTRR